MPARAAVAKIARARHARAMLSAVLRAGGHAPPRDGLYADAGGTRERVVLSFLSFTMKRCRHSVALLPLLARCQRYARRQAIYDGAPAAMRHYATRYYAMLIVTTLPHATRMMLRYAVAVERL